jgi:hypothetical protein
MGFSKKCRDHMVSDEDFPQTITWVIKCPHFSHHPTIRYMVYNGYYKVMSNIPKMGQLPPPALENAHVGPKNNPPPASDHRATQGCAAHGHAAAAEALGHLANLGSSGGKEEAQCVTWICSERDRMKERKKKDG